MSIIAKFTCESVTKFNNGAEHVKLRAVMGGSDANKQWAKFTPAGVLEMTIDNPPAQGQLVPGKEYLVTIAPAPDDE